MCHDVIGCPHIPVPKHGKPWTSKMVMFTANASHESASIPWQTLCLPKKYATFLRFERSWKILIHLQLNMVPRVLHLLTPSPNEITSKKTIDIHLENHGENQAHIGSIGLHHTFRASRSITTAEDLSIFWKSIAKGKTVEALLWLIFTIYYTFWNHTIGMAFQLSKCPISDFRVAQAQQVIVDGLQHMSHLGFGESSPPNEFWVRWSSSLAKAHPGTCTHESRHQSTATCENCHHFLRWTKNKKSAKTMVPLTILHIIWSWKKKLFEGIWSWEKNNLQVCLDSANLC